MSEISLYPQGIDIFNQRIDATGPDDSRDEVIIYAEHVNRVQNAITAIELALGTNPQGDSSDVTQRLYSLSNNKALTLPRITIHKGNPIGVNLSTSKEEAARHFSYFSLVLLDSIDPYTAVMLDARDVIEEANRISTTRFYGTIDAGVSTANLPTSDVEDMIGRWKDIGVAGIYFKNFGYDMLVDRERQNALVQLVRNAELVTMVSAPNIDHVFSIDNITGMNPGNLSSILAHGDGYLAIDYAAQGASYQNAAELMDLSSKMIANRSAVGVSMYGLAIISGSDEQTKNRMYYYGQAAAMVYSLDGFHATDNIIAPQTTYAFKTLPLVGNYYDAQPVVKVNGNVISRATIIGKISVDLASHTYDFKNLRIPLGLVDFEADDSTISAARLSGALSPSVTFDVMGRINAATGTISANRVDQNGTKIIEAINMVSLGTTKISADAIESLSNASIEDIVIEVLGQQLEVELASGELDANFRRLMAQFVSAQNAYFTALKAETGVFNGLNAGMITTGHLSAGLIDVNTITSDKLSIVANAGLNKWSGTVVTKAAGAIIYPNRVNIAGKDAYRKIEVKDTGVLNASDIIGTALTNYVVMWETNVFCSSVFNFSTTLTANSHARLTINDGTVATVSPGGSQGYTTTLQVGWNKITLYQDHNSEANCTANIGINLSEYARQTETLKYLNGLPCSPTAVTRVDAYSSVATQITGDVIKTGTVDADRIKANSITATQIQAGSIGATEIAADAIKATHLDAGSVTAEAILAGTITGDKLVVDAITTREIAVNAVDAENIKAGAIVAGKIAADAIVAANIQADAITAGKIATDAVTAREIAANAITASEISADAVTAGKIAADAITAREIAANAITASEISANAVTAGKIDADAITAREIAADAITAEQLNANAVTAGKIDADAITAREIAANAVTAEQILAGAITTDKLDADEVSAGLVQAGIIDAIDAYVKTITAEEGTFAKLLTDLVAAKFINANNVKITSEARSIGGATGILTIDKGGMEVSDQPKVKLAVVNEKMNVVTGRTYRTVHFPINEQDDLSNAPVFGLRATGGTGAGTPLDRSLYELTYEYGQISIDPSVDLVNKEAVATYTYNDVYYPINARVVRIDREGVSISNDGGRTWKTKLDGNNLRVDTAAIADGAITNAKIIDGAISNAKIGDAQITSAKISSLDAGKITAGTLDAATASAVTINVGGSITLNSTGMHSTNFNIGTDGNVSITGTLTAQTGSKIANWNIGANTISDTNSKIVLDSSVPSINIDGGKVVIGKYDATNYGIKAIAGLIGTMSIDASGIIVGSTGRITDAMASPKYQLDSTGLMAIAGKFGSTNYITIDSSGLVLGTGRILDRTSNPLLVIDSTGINAQTGSFGASANKITVDDKGLVLGTGSIVDTRVALNQKLKIDANGIVALKGYIGGLEINESINGLVAKIDVLGEMVDQFSFTPNTITLSGDEALTINTGTMVVKDAGVTYVTLGKLATNVYGLKVDLATAGRYVQLDQNGLRAYNGTTNTLNIGSDGNVSITGTINATAGTFAGVTVNGSISVGNGGSIAVSGTGSITAGSNTLNASGLTLRTGDINIGTGQFVVTSAGALTAQSATVTGTVNATGGYFGNATNGVTVNTDGIEVKGTGVIKNANTKIERSKITIYKDTTYTTPGIIMGLYDATNYGIKAGNTILNDSGISIQQGSINLGSGLFQVTNAGALTAQSGTIAGWTIDADEIKNADSTFVLDSTNGVLKLSTDKIVLNKTGAATLGKLTINADGSIATAGNNFQVSTSGNVTITGAITATSGTFSGAVNATSGWFGTSGAHVDITGNGLQAGSVVLDNTGLKVGSSVAIDASGITIFNGSNSSINLGGKFIANSTGITAIAGTIGGWTIGSTTLTAGRITLDSTGNITVKNASNIATITLDGATGKLTASDVDLTGKVTATSGKIGGWFISGDSIVDNEAAPNITIAPTAISISNQVTMGLYDMTNYGIKAGSTLLNASGITAIQGAIGGWTLSTTDIYNGNIHIDKGNSAIWIGTSIGAAAIRLNADGSAKLGGFNVETDGDIYTGASWAASTFKVTAAGALTATSGAIGGWTIGTSSLSSNNVAINSAGNITLGATGQVVVSATSGIAVSTDQFTVSLAGAVTAKNITATGGKIANWTIGTNTLSAGSVNIDATSGSEHIDIGTNVILRPSGTTKLGLLSLNMTDGSLDTGTGFKVDSAGKLAATAGTIGNWTIAANTLTAGNIVIDATAAAQKISIGTNIILNTNGSATLGKFSVATDGTISTTGGFSVNASGQLSATAGTIGAWTLSATEISHSNIHIDTANDAIWMGASYATANIKLNSAGSATIGKFAVAADGSISTGGGFSVATDGKITATGGTVGGFTLGASTLYANTNSVILDATGYKLSFNNSAAIFGQYVAAKYGMKVGNFVINGTDSQMYVGADYASAAFKIDLANGNATLANATLTSATISGSVTAASGKIGNWNIGANTLTAGTITLDATAASEKIKITKTGDATKYVQLDGTGLSVVGGLVNIVTGTTNLVKIDGTGIKAGGVSQYAQLSDTGLTIVGGAVDISTATTANKVVINNTGIIAYADANNRVEMRPDGVYCVKGGTDIGSAITKDGIIGQLLTDQSIAGSKFDKTAPSVPTGVAVQQIVEQTATSEFINIKVTWTQLPNQAAGQANSDLEGYKVYLKEGTSLYYPMAIVQKDQGEYVIRNVKGSTQYYVGVSSFDVTGNESVKSTDVPILTTKDTVAPAKVGGLVTVDGPKMFYIKWNPIVYNWNGTTGAVNTGSPCTDLDYYEVQRKAMYVGATIEDWTTINKTYSTGIIDKDVSYDYDYNYRIRGVDLSGNYAKTSGVDEWATVNAGKPSKIGSADIVAGSITADVLNVGSMVKSINPMKSMLFHFDGVTTSTQDARPTSISGGSWSDGKFGDGLALEEPTINIASELTSGNAGFKNGISGWTISGAEYLPSGGAGGSSDGCLTVTDIKKASITVTTVIGQKYAVSVYGRAAIFTEQTNLIVKANGVEIIDSAVLSEWRRIFYVFTAAATSTTFEFLSSNGYTAYLDNVQIEQRSFVTAFTESYTLEGRVRPEGKLQYMADRLNPMKGTMTFWFKPNRSGASPNTLGQVLWMWGEQSGDNSKGLFLLEVTSDNRPRLTIVSGGVARVISHEASVDAMAWNNISLRWTFDTSLTADKRFAEIYLNGTESGDKINLSDLPIPTMTAAVFTIGNHNDGGYCANGSFDEMRIDNDCVMDAQEKEEIISWYKSASMFYDAASQIDADSQGISAANAKITINGDGITVRDGLMRVISDDGVILIGDGRININGMNVGIVQSDNEVYNGNFGTIATLYGMGDAYINMDGFQNYGAKYWRNRRSSAYSYSNALINATWNQLGISSVFDFTKVYNDLFAGYDAGTRAQEAATHTIENIIRATPPISLMSPGAAKEALVADTLEDELVYQIEKLTNDKYDEWMNFGLSFVRYNDANGNMALKGARINPTTKDLEYVQHTMNMWSGGISVKTDPVTYLPVSTIATEANGLFGHTQYEVWPENSYLGKTGYAKLGVNTIDEKPASEQFPANGVASVFTLATSSLVAAISAVSLVDIATQAVTSQVAGIDYIPDAVTKKVTFMPGKIPAAGKLVVIVYNTIDVSAQSVSVEQDLPNLVTYTDGMDPEDTNWEQHIFTFYAKWNSKPVGSQSKLKFQVEELVPNYTIASGVATQVPSYTLKAHNTVIDQNTYLLQNTDFVTQRYQAALGHATWPTDHANHKKYTLDSIRYATVLPALKVRYIRDWVNGNSSSATNLWCEIAAYDMVGTNVALGKTVTGSVPENATYPYSRITNGDPTTASYARASVDGLQWVQVDLGQAYTLSAINLWHFNARTMHEARTQVSEDGIKWYDVYNYLYQGEYAEANNLGKTIGGLTGMTPNPILVEEVFTPKGETLAGKANWTIGSDGTTYGSQNSKYLKSQSEGDVVMFAFNNESICDIVLNMLKDSDVGSASIFMDNMFVGEADLSSPYKAPQLVDYKSVMPGSHIACLVTTGNVGLNTTGSLPTTCIVNQVDFYAWEYLGTDYMTEVEYEETDSTSWNKVTIKPNKCNTKDNGTPLITTSKVPIRYRCKVVMEKPVNDPFSASALITGIQAEIGQNESFTRVNYGIGGMPGSMIQSFSTEFANTGIQTKHLQEHRPNWIMESGFYERHIADYQITTRKMAKSAVTAEVIASGNVTHDKLAMFVDAATGHPRHKLAMNLDIADFDYPIILAANVDPMIRFVPMEVDVGSEEIKLNGQELYPGDDYTIEIVTAAQRVDDPTKIEKATKITLLRTVSMTDQVWGKFWLPIE